MFGKCTHGTSPLELACQAVGTLGRIWLELQSLNGRLHRVERYLVAQAPGYPLLPAGEAEQQRLRAVGIASLPGEEATHAHAS